jgi:hypothetical protein
MTAVTPRKLAGFVFLALAANGAFWLGAKDIYAKWAGVPPPPDRAGAVMMSLGDEQFSYRFGALNLQILGDTGGQVTALSDYSYDKLGQWFRLLNTLDPASNHVPMVAAFYFGGTQKPEDVAHVVDYLEQVGQVPIGNKWRWLAHAVFLARHRMNDLDRALDLAYKLSRMEPIGDELPIWARQMPIFVLKATGEKDDARALMENMLRSSDADIHPNEINFMKGYLIEQLGVDEAEVDRMMKERRSNIVGPPKPRKTLPAFTPGQ